MNLTKGLTDFPSSSDVFLDSPLFYPQLSYQDEEITTLICRECVEFLYQCDNFKKKCLISDKKMRTSPFIIKEEIHETVTYEVFESDGNLKTEFSDYKYNDSNQRKKRKSKRSTKLESEEKTPENLTSSDLKADKNPRLCCDLCGKFLVGTGSLKKHMLSHYGIKVCQLTIIYLFFLMFHQFQDYKCTIPDCNKSFITKWKLQEHVNRHKGIRNYECHQCGLKKTTSHELKVHLNYHTKERLYKCEFCEQVFASMGNRLRHTKVVHLGIKAFACQFCNSNKLRTGFFILT